EARGPFSRRLIGGVWIVDVDPGEPLPGLRIDPLQRRGHDRVRGPFALALLDRGAAAESIVVPIESDVQAEPPVERESADEGTGRETASLQLGGQRRPLRVESI